jgi:ATP-dependent Clp protease protease subunit
MDEKNLKHSRKSSYDIDDSMFTLHEYDLDYENNEIYLTGIRDYSVGTGADFDQEPGVEHIMAGRFIKNMQTLMRKKGNDPILIHMKTNGGHWKEGMAIYDMIKNCPNPVTILNYTHARSMSSLIFLAANKRVMMPHSDFMFHEGQMYGGGTVKQYLTEAEEVKKADNQMLNIYVNCLKKQGYMSKWSRKRIRQWLVDKMNLKEDVYVNAKDAVKYGFADEVFNGNWDKLTEYTDKQLEID